MVVLVSGVHRGVIPAVQYALSLAPDNVTAVYVDMDPAATAKAVSGDGYLYTGDMGFVDDKGLHFAGRAKWIIKPKGYQVYPGQVEDYLCELREKAAWPNFWLWFGLSDDRISTSGRVNEGSAERNFLTNRAQKTLRQAHATLINIFFAACFPACVCTPDTDVTVSAM